VTAVTLPRMKADHNNLKIGESVMGEASSTLRYLSLIGTVAFSFAITTTWAALLGYGLFRLGAWALAG
jgi:hypothetical protein